MSNWYDNQPTGEEMDKMCCYPDIHKNRKESLTQFYLNELDHIRGVVNLRKGGSISKDKTLISLIYGIVKKIKLKEEEL